jgi:hypothetical protein
MIKQEEKLAGVIITADEPVRIEVTVVRDEVVVEVYTGNKKDPKFIYTHPTY